MSVNQMNIEDARLVLNSLHSQVTGQAGITPTNTADFVSMATTTLQAGTDIVFNTLSQMITKTIIAVRPYEAQFTGLELTSDEWGAIVRKISFADREAPESIPFDPAKIAEGQTVDMYTIRKPDVLEMRFYGSDAYDDYYTTYEVQLKPAFESEGAFSAFVSGLITSISNKWTQWAENMKRMTLLNHIGSRTAEATAGRNTECVVHLIAEYNAETGLNLTKADILKPDNVGNFFRWTRAKINTIAREMGARSEKFHTKVQGKHIMRQTKPQDMRIYMLAGILDKIDMMVNTTTYHNEPLALADVEGVTYWQAIDNPDEIQVTPSYIAANGTVATAAAQTLTDVAGILFDRDAMGVNFYEDSIHTTPLNAAGLYWNTFLHRRARYFNDMTENSVVLMLD